MPRGRSHPPSVCFPKRRVEIFCYILTKYLVQLRRYKSPSSGILAPPDLRSVRTQLQFHPTRQSILFAACRQTDEIILWDVRNTSSRFHTFTRKSKSNQRMHFDADTGGHWLATGTTVRFLYCGVETSIQLLSIQDGYVSFYDVQTLAQVEPVSTFKLHNGE
jgi:hypothetical protein